MRRLLARVVLCVREVTKAIVIGTGLLVLGAMVLAVAQLYAQSMLLSTVVSVVYFFAAIMTLFVIAGAWLFEPPPPLLFIVAGGVTVGIGLGLSILAPLPLGYAWWTQGVPVLTGLVLVGIGVKSK